MEPGKQHDGRRSSWPKRRRTTGDVQGQGRGGGAVDGVGQVDPGDRYNLRDRNPALAAADERIVAAPARRQASLLRRLARAGVAA